RVSRPARRVTPGGAGRSAAPPWSPSALSCRLRLSSFLPSLYLRHRPLPLPEGRGKHENLLASRARRSIRVPCLRRRLSRLGRHLRSLAIQFFASGSIAG